MGGHGDAGGSDCANTPLGEDSVNSSCGEGTQVHKSKPKDLIIGLDFRFTSLQAKVDGLLKHTGELMDEVATAKEHTQDTSALLRNTIFKLHRRIRTLKREPWRDCGVIQGDSVVRYVMHTELEGCDYATLANVGEKVGTESRRTGVPTRLGARLRELKLVVLGPGPALISPGAN